MRKDIKRKIIVLKNLAKRLSPAKKRDRNSFIALIYHRIGAGDTVNFVPSLVNASVDEFEREILFLRRNFNIISPEALTAALERTGQLPPKGLLITFDDGYRDNYTQAFPILKKYGVPAIIFLTSDFIDPKGDLIWIDKVAFLICSAKCGSLAIPGLKTYDIRTRTQKKRAVTETIAYLMGIDETAKNKIIGLLDGALGVRADGGIAKSLYLYSEEISEMSRCGISFGSHGRSHAILSRIDAGRARDEIVNSKLKIERLLGRKTDLFAYPNGGTGDFSDMHAQILKDCGYKAAFTTILGSNTVDNGPGMYALKRITAGRSLFDLKKNMFLYSVC